MKIPMPDGIGSGIKIKDLVDDLVKAESQDKIAKFDKDETTTLAKISGLGTLKSALSEFSDYLESFQNVNQFGLYTTSATLANNVEVISATAGSNAAIGNYLVEVDQLAYAQKLGSTSFEENYTVVGTGNLIFTMGTAIYTFNITSANSTLQGINDTINASSSVTGITSSLITTNTGTSIVFSSPTGTNNIFTVSVTDDGDANNTDNSGLSQLASNNLTTLQSAQNAIVKIEGVPITSDSNTLKYAIEGVTIDLLTTNVGHPVTLSVNVDIDSANGAITQFVDSYNHVFEVISNLTQFDPKNKTKAKGVLIGDSTLRSIEFQMRDVISKMMTSQPAGYSTISQIGITTDQYTGKLVIKEAQLMSALNSNFDAVGSLFMETENGLIASMDSALEPYIEVNGIIQSKTDGLSSSLEVIDLHRISLERHLKSLEKRLTSQFIAMDMLVTKLNSLREYLDQQLESFPEPMMFRK